jgi:hypothetical protein
MDVLPIGTPAGLPVWALGVILCVALMGALSLLSILAKAARNEIEVHNFKVRVTTLRNEYERTLRALRGEEEGEFDILEDEDEVIEAIPVDEFDNEEGDEEPVRAAA